MYNISICYFQSIVLQYFHVCDIIDLDHLIIGIFCPVKHKNCLTVLQSWILYQYHQFGTRRCPGITLALYPGTVPTHALVSHAGFAVLTR